MYNSTVCRNRINLIKSQPYEYLYGGKYTGKVIKVSDVDRLKAENPDKYTKRYYQDTINKVVGKYGIDCSGLICYVMDMSDVGSYTIAGWSENQGFNNYEYLEGMQLVEHDILWKPGHVALVEDAENGVTFEARGLYDGVGNFKVEGRGWERVIRPTVNVWAYPEIGWIHEGDGTWWYAYGHRRGEYYKSCLVNIKGELFAFDGEGYLIKNGVMQTNERGAISEVMGAERYKS